MVQETETGVKRRVNALKNLQLQLSDLETKLSDEIHKLECKYASQFDAIYDQRQKIVNGDYEPTEQESTWNYADDEEDEDEDEEKQTTNGAGGSSSSSSAAASDPKGIPDFWLTAFAHNPTLNGIITERDEPVLKHLRDVRVKLDDSNRSYTIEFHFNENEFFSNRVLTKTYVLNTEKNPSNPLQPNMPMLLKCTGTKIDWKEGKDVTQREPKKPANKKKGKSSQEEEDNDDDEAESSFFQIFDTHTEDGLNPLAKSAEELKNVEDEEMEEIVSSFEIDYEIGQVLRDAVVPKAVLYYTGQVDDEEEDQMGQFGFDEDDDDEDEDDDDDDDDDDDESEEEEKPKKKAKTSRH